MGFWQDWVSPRTGREQAAEALRGWPDFHADDGDRAIHRYQDAKHGTHTPYSPLYKSASVAPERFDALEAKAKRLGRAFGVTILPDRTSHTFVTDAESYKELNRLRESVLQGGMER